jgi:hypothetical protein
MHEALLMQAKPLHYFGWFPVLVRLCASIERAAYVRLLLHDYAYRTCKVMRFQHFHRLE